MFRGLNTKPPDAATVTGNDLRHDDIALHAVCVSELDHYLHDVINKGACPMYDADDAFNNTLKWWKENCTKYPYVANIALQIPCHSCNVSTIRTSLEPFGKKKSLRRAHLSDDLVGRMMFMKKNLVLLHKHYHELRKKETVKELHHLVNLEFNYFSGYGVSSHLVSSTYIHKLILRST
jgi:hypothetical protein